MLGRRVPTPTILVSRRTVNARSMAQGSSLGRALSSGAPARRRLARTRPRPMQFKDDEVCRAQVAPLWLRSQLPHDQGLIH
jgi:hypothetical protein